MHVGFFGEKDLSHRNRLKRLLRDLSQYGGGVKPNFGALGRRITRHRRQPIVAKHVVHRRLQIGVAEALDDDSVNVRNLSVHRLCAIDAHDRSDSHRRIDRRPEMKLVRRIGLPLRCDYSAKRFAHEIALRNSSQSRTP